MAANFAIAAYAAMQYKRIIQSQSNRGQTMFSLIRLIALLAPMFFGERAAAFRR
jgi:hypothetical protein